jgi:hypothetical protein
MLNRRLLRLDSDRLMFVADLSKMTLYPQLPHRYFMLIAGAGWIVGGSLLPGVFWQLGASTDGSKRTAISPTASFSGVVRENMPVYAQEIEKRTSPDGISTW